MKVIDLNADLGEGKGTDEELLQIVSSASICCGGHAGSSELTLQVLGRSRELGVRTGCHPGVPDRSSMGRAPIGELDRIHFNQMVDDLFRQISVAPESWTYLKPHGSLYNESTKLGTTAFRLVKLLIEESRLSLMGLANTAHEDLATYGLIREGFLDRRYTSTGTLVARSESNALLTDGPSALLQSFHLMDRVDSFCVHGDNPNALVLAKFVMAGWRSAGIEVARWD